MSQQFSSLEYSQQALKKDITISSSSYSMKVHSYMDYSPELVTSALKDGKQVVLFFAAPWCPSCRSLDKAIQADLGSIGTGTLIVRVDYDTSTDLKRQYGVVTQHTIVVLNPDGREKSKKI
jgi:thioredoxin 1